jgi:hypothetical protein
MQSEWRRLTIVFALSCLFRGAVIGLGVWGFTPLGGLDTDPDAYRLIAETLSATDTFGIPDSDGGTDPTAFRPPLYPWILSHLTVDAQISILAVAILHTLLGAITCVATYAFTANWVRTQREPDVVRWSLPAILASILVAVDPLLLMQSTLVMTETLATALAVVTLWLLALTSPHPVQRSPSSRHQNTLVWISIASLLAISFLCRPTFLVWTVLIIAWLTIRAVIRANLRAESLIALIAILMLSGATVTAWTERNSRAMGRPIWATTHGGYTLLLGNNPYFYDYLHDRSFGSASLWGDAWQAEPFHRDWQFRVRTFQDAQPGKPDAIKLELANDALAGRWAKETISAQPKTFVYASLVRVVRLWSPIPRIGENVTGISYFLAAYYALLYAAALCAILRQRRCLWSPVWIGAALLALSLTVVHAVYWSNFRMRSPVVPAIMALAAISILPVRKEHCFYNRVKSV